jgi:hypothetical protein
MISELSIWGNPIRYSKQHQNTLLRPRWHPIINRNTSRARVKPSPSLSQLLHGHNVATLHVLLQHLDLLLQLSHGDFLVFDHQVDL